MGKISRWLKRLDRPAKSIVRHPYFGFIVLGLILVFALFLYGAGLLTISVYNTIIQTMIYSIVALGFSILLGYGGLASLGTAGFVGLGSFIMGYFSGIMEWPLLYLDFCR